MQDDKKKEGRHPEAARKFIKVFLIFCMIVLIIVLAGGYLLEKNNARIVLHNAKLIRLATQNVYYDYYAADKPFFEDNGQGLYPGREKEILNLAQCDGRIYHVEFDADSFRVSSMIYTEKGFVVEFVDSSDAPQWTVYKLKKLID